MVESADIGWRKQVKNCLSCHNCNVIGGKI